MSEKKETGCTDKEFLPLMCDTLPEKYRLKASKELDETEENIKNGLALLRECIKNEKLAVSTNETFLLSILRPTKYNFKKDEEKLRNFPKVFQIWAEYMKSSNVEKVKAVLDHKMVGLLPFRDDEGRVVLFARPKAWEKTKFSLDDAALCMISLLLFAFSFPLSSVCGFNYLNDASTNSVYDLVQILTGFRKMTSLWTLLPYRFKRADSFKNSYLDRCFYMTIRPILPAKLKNRIFLYGNDFESLAKVYPPSMLPYEFGGTMGPLSADSYLDSFLEFVQNLQTELCR